MRWWLLVLILTGIRADNDVSNSTASTHFTEQNGNITESPVTYTDDSTSTNVLVKNIKKTLVYPPQTFPLNSEVTSGPIILVNKKHLYVPNFHFKNGQENIKFWVGNNTTPSSEDITFVPVKNPENLQNYEGRNLDIEWSDDKTTDNTEYFGVWSTDRNVSLGHVQIQTKEIQDVPEPPQDNNSSLRTVLRLPKCCPFDSALNIDGCNQTESVIVFEPKFNVYEHNETHFSNESLDISLIDFEPFYLSPDCRSGSKFALDAEQEEFALLQNTSLLLKSKAVSGILSINQFCIENVQDQETENFQMKILICTPDVEMQTGMLFFAYVSLTLISTLCLAVTFFIYCFLLQFEDTHRKCFTAYALSMSITFLILTIVQAVDIEDSGCVVLGFFFQIFMISSFTLLAVLCFDIWIIMKYADERELKKKRKLWYSLVTVLVPLISLIISLSRNLTPDIPNSFFKPQYSKNNCIFNSQEQRAVLFYIPIGSAIIVSIVFLILARLKMVQNDKTLVYDDYWISKGRTYKYMFRQCLLTLIIMTLAWISNILMSFLDESSSICYAANIFESLQGVLIVAVYSVHYYSAPYLDKPRRLRSNDNALQLLQNNDTSGGANT